MRQLFADLRIVWLTARSTWKVCRKHGFELIGVAVQPLLARDVARLLEGAGQMPRPRKDETLN
jgi:hypothetical protein